MISVLEPLVKIPGVRVALLVGTDGVPVVARSKNPNGNGNQGEVDGIDSNTDALAALASGWLGEMSRAVAPLSWTAPTRVVLWASRGTLIMSLAPGAVLLVVLDRGIRSEDLRLPMGSAAARIQRLLRTMRSEREEREERDALADFEDDAEPPSALPTAKVLDLKRDNNDRRNSS